MPKEQLEEQLTALCEKLQGLAEAYPEDIFTPLTKAEIEQHSAIVTRASADMGRYFGKTFAEIAAQIKELKNDVTMATLAEENNATRNAIEKEPAFIPNAKRLNNFLEALEERFPTVLTNSDLGAPEDVYLRCIDALMVETKYRPCWCHACVFHKVTQEGTPLEATRMILCPTCGNKRCPKASNHVFSCTGSNEKNQVGSIYQNNTKTVG